MKRAVLAVLVVGALLPASAQAAFPGANGKIAFVRAGDIWTMNPDGTGQVNLTNSAADESNPAWSPDGNRIAFDSNNGSGFTRQVYWMFADGTSVTPVTATGREDPTWSPSGNQLAYIVAGGPAIYKINLDGTGETYVSEGGEDTLAPSWSPDGSQIAYAAESGPPPFPCWYDVFTVSAGGGDDFNVTQCSGAPASDLAINLDPNWSPDGARIAFAGGCTDGCNNEIALIDPDGTDRVDLTGVGGGAPAWSPDGIKIAYAGFDTNANSRVKVVNADGTNIVDVTDGTLPDWQPLNQAGPDADVLTSITDAPDPIKAGGVLTYTAQVKNLVGPDDATGVTFTVTLPASVFYISATSTQGSCSESAGTVTCNIGNLNVGQSATVTIQVEPQSGGSITANANVTATENDPVLGNNASSATTTVQLGGYPRPKGADPLRVSLVPAYRTCDPSEATLTHGPPLASPSCAAPALTSAYLRVGTPDANGAAANSVGSVLIYPLGEGPPIDPNNGDQADVAYKLSLTDVRKQSDLSDYTGALEVQATLRITDRKNTFSGNAPATSQDASISFSAPCAATASTTIGGACSVSTTQEAIVPGSVDERKRAIWELGKVRVFDGGADGNTATGPNTLFAVQGLFVP